MIRAMLLVLLLGLPLQAGDVLVSGNGFAFSEATFTGNLAQLNHTFASVTQAELGSTDFTGFSAIWLDGFSSYDTLPTQGLIAFMEAGGTLLVQNPGFGGNGLASYPFGEGLSATYVEEGNGVVVISEPGHPVNAGLSQATLSDWTPTSALGYFSQIGDFTGLTDSGAENQWITIVRNVGAGTLIYTHQPIAQALNETALNPNSGPLKLLNNIVTSAEPLSLTPPRFIPQEALWLAANGDLEILLPDPNSDGLDPDGSAGLGYQLTIEAEGTPVLGPIEVSGSWPQSVTIPAASLPAGSWYLGVARTAAGLDSSAPLLLNGPTAIAQDPGILRLYKRWLLHTPREAGGFSGLVRLENRNPDDSATVTLVGFAADGEERAVVSTTLDPGERRDLPLYGSLFSIDQQDMISHIAIWEPAGNLRAALRYRADISGFAVWVPEVNLTTQPGSGKLFHMDGSSPSQAYYDGVAVTNLSSAVTPEIIVRRYAEDGGSEGQISLGTLAPGAKVIDALSFSFETFVPNASYEIEAVSDEPGASIQVVGLSGAADGTFFATAYVTRTR